jgi:peptidoglycan/xylan/chitin deacetylase (PgdA/CDA1 family)
MPILMYHRICDEGPAALSSWRVPLPDFERQIAWLANEGYTSIGLDDWLKLSKHDTASAARRVVLTFDDAYADFVSAAFPVLQHYGFGATMFVPTGLMGAAAEWDREFGDPAQLMSWAELDALVSAGVEIGAHTITHPRLTKVTDDAELAHEISVSRSELIARYGQPVSTFAYPFGDFDARVEQAIRNAGFTLAVTIDPQSAGDFAVGRLKISGDEPFTTFVKKIEETTRGR